MEYQLPILESIVTYILELNENMYILAYNNGIVQIWDLKNIICERLVSICVIYYYFMFVCDFYLYICMYMSIFIFTFLKIFYLIHVCTYVYL